MALVDGKSVRLSAFENGLHRGASPSFDTCIFDLDDTLYPLSTGIAAACRKNIRDYMTERLGVDPNHVVEFNMELYTAYGTSMAGLRAKGYSFDFDDWHAYVHGRLPYEVLNYDPVLKGILHNMPQRKIVFTNGDRKHAAKVLKALGLENSFELVICFEDLMEQPPLSHYPYEALKTALTSDLVSESWIGSGGALICCKPQPEAFLRALSLAKANPARTIFFDDSARNIVGAKAVGLHTVLVGTSVRTAGADWAIESIHNVREAIPELWHPIGPLDEGVFTSSAVVVNA